jgi:TPR repeat protein
MQQGVPDEDAAATTSESPQTRAWLRFGARMVDIWLFTVGIGTLLALVASDLRGAILVCWLLWPVVEAILLSTWGTTPGKALLCIHLESLHRQKLDFLTALSRSVAVFFYGMAIGLPIISLFTLYAAYKRLIAVGEASWDEKRALWVWHERIRPLRGAVVTVVFLLIVFLIGFENFNRVSSQTTAARASAEQKPKALAEKNPKSAHFAKLRANAEKGDAGAQARLGAMYLNGDGVAKDRAEAATWYRKAAEQGHAGAQFVLGSMYFFIGDGVTKDSAEAAKWYRRAAEQGDAEAQALLGAMYLSGEGVSKNSTEAVKWYRKAAEQGDAEAQRGLGIMYHAGEGVAKDSTEAVKWYRKAAEQGHTKVQFQLGRMYADGEGVPKDLVQAHVWWNIAGANGHEDAKKNLAVVEKKMNPEQKAEAEKLAREIWEKIEARKQKAATNR